MPQFSRPRRNPLFVQLGRNPVESQTLLAQRSHSYNRGLLALEMAEWSAAEALRHHLGKLTGGPFRFRSPVLVPHGESDGSVECAKMPSCQLATVIKQDSGVSASSASLGVKSKGSWLRPCKKPRPNRLRHPDRRPLPVRKGVSGGRRGIRTPDPRIANAVLSQLS